MNVITTCLSLLITFSFCYAQNNGILTSKDVKPRVNYENHYIYTIDKSLIEAIKNQLSEKDKQVAQQLQIIQKLSEK